MTKCTGSLADESLESYLQGTLSEAEALQFEDHYFDCPVCLGQLEALRAVRDQLSHAPQHGTPSIKHRVLAWPVRLTALGAIAASLLVALIGLHNWRQKPIALDATASTSALESPAQHQPNLAQSDQRQPPQAQPAAASIPAKPEQSKPTLAAGAMARLADLTLPVFRASTLRGQSRDAEFDTGMKAYADQDCAAAIQHLRLVPARDEDALAARFYSGLCQMHQGNFSAASKTLREVAQAGDSPQQEAAYYYLAQISLAANDIPTARFNLALAFQLRGDFEKRARTELVKLHDADGSISR